MLRRVGSGVDIIPLVDISANKAPERQASELKNTMPNLKFFQTQQDPLLIQRVKEYLALNADNPQVDVGEMAEYLQQRHREYSRRKRRPFHAIVKNAYEALMYQFSKLNSLTQSSTDDEEEDDIIDESELLQPLTMPNCLNDGLLKLYKQKTLEQGEPINITISSDDSQDELAVSNNTKIDEVRVVKPNEVQNNAVDASSDLISNEPPKIANPKDAKTKENASHFKLRLLKDAAQTTESRKRKLTTNSLPSVNVPTKKRREVPAIQPKVTFKDVGGINKILEDVCKLLVHVKHPEIYRQIGISPPRGFLLHGPPGCGKTLLAHAISGELNVPLIKVAAPELVAGVSGESEERIRELFEQANLAAPCVLFIDEVDAITPNRQQAQREMERRIVAQLLACLDELSQNESNDSVLVIGATNRPDAIDPALRRAGRFDREVCMGIPDLQAREHILRVLCAPLKLNAQFDYDLVATYTPGFVGADLMALVREAAMAAVNRVFQVIKDQRKQILEEIIPEDIIQVVETAEPTVEPEPSASTSNKNDAPPVIPESTVPDGNDLEIAVNSDPPKPKTLLDELITWLHDRAPLTSSQLDGIQIELNDFQNALKCVQPSAKREGFATVPDVTWDDVGSLQHIREELQMAILAPVRHANEFESLGIMTPTGVLLCGPPGCGKTLLAKAIANEAGVNFISVKGPELLNMYVGESERAVRLCFQRARNSAPCVIFFDELDALCPKRSDTGENGATMRVVNQMLTEMDGVEGRRGVYLMAASNRPDIIDPAVLRPGRLDKILYVGLPSADDRVDILRAVTKNGTRPKLAADVDLSIIGRSEQCAGYTGADLAALVREAGVQALREYMIHEKRDYELTVTAVHFGLAIGKIRPSVTEKDQKHYEKLKKCYAAPQVATADDIEDVHMDDA